MEYTVLLNIPDQDHNKYWSELGNNYDSHESACKAIDDWRKTDQGQFMSRRMTNRDYKIWPTTCQHAELLGHQETGTRGVYTSMRCTRCGTNINGGWNKVY